MVCVKKDVGRVIRCMIYYNLSIIILLIYLYKVMTMDNYQL